MRRVAQGMGRGWEGVCVGMVGMRVVEADVAVGLAGGVSVCHGERVAAGEDVDEDALRKYQLERLRYVDLSQYGGFPHPEPRVDITTLSSNVIPFKPLRTSSMSWMVLSLNAPPTSSTSASYLMT